MIEVINTIIAILWVFVACVGIPAGLYVVWIMLFGIGSDENPVISLIRQSGARTRIRMEQLKDEAVAKAKEGRYEEDETPDDVYPGRTEDEPWR